jgi:hypothetical protein
LNEASIKKLNSLGQSIQAQMTSTFKSVIMLQTHTAKRGQKPIT